MKLYLLAIKVLIFSFILLFYSPLFGAVNSSVILSVKERTGVDRINEYVSFGVPVPLDWDIKNTSTLRISNSQGVPIPAQFSILARWKGHAEVTSAPAKWVLIGFFADVSANATEIFTLDRNGPGTSFSPAISVDNTLPDKLIIDTGDAIFEVNKTGNENLINQVTIQGRKLLIPLNSASAIDYDPMGAVSIVAGGTPNTTPRTRSVVVERQGTLNCVVKITGSIIGDTFNPVLDYTARLLFYAGSSDVRLDFIVENNHPVIESDGAPTNIHAQGDINSVYIGGLKLAMQLADSGSSLRVRTEKNVDLTQPSSFVKLYQDSSGTDYWDVYVGDVGWGTSESPLAPATPRLQSYCSQKGFTVTGPSTSATGDQAVGWMSASITSGPGISISYRDFWQNFPKAIQVETDGTIFVDLFPNGSRFRHNLRVGEEKTHTMLFRFNSTPITSDEAENLALAFNTPLFGVAPASWYVDSKALGSVPEANSTKWPLYENYVNVAFKPNPQFDPQTDDAGYGNTTLKETIEKYNFFGWQDYGDVPLDYEAFGPNQAGQMNLKYWYVYGMFLQFCRSAELNWLDLALPAARHEADIDFLHIPDSGIQHWAHGSYFGHSDHDEPGNTNPNRNYNSPSVDLFYGVPDLLLSYYLTGEQRFKDTALEGLEAMANLSQFSNFSYPVFYRERACLIFGYLEGYKQTGNSQWLTNMKTIISQTMNLSNKDWMTDPLNYSPPPGGPEGESERVSSFQVSQTLWTIGRYLDFCEEYNLTDDTGAVNSLEAYGDFIIDHLMKEISSYLNTYHPGEFTQNELNAYSGHYAVVDSIWFTADFETYLEINNWALLVADTLTYIYKYSGKKKYLDAAQKLYLTGTLDQVWLGDPPVYIASKDLVNSCNFGLVYMNETNQTTTNDCETNEYPSAPVLTSPSGIILDMTPELIWDEDTKATWYQVYISHTSDNSKYVQWYEIEDNDSTAPDVSCSEGKCSVTLGSALKNGEYEWWVRGWNNCGNGDWSNGMSVTVQSEDTPPSKVTQSTPSGTTQDSSPTYTWIEDPASTWYKFWIGFPNGDRIFAEWFDAIDICAGGNCSVTLESELIDGEYEWYIKSWNDYGRIWSDGMSFTITD